MKNNAMRFGKLIVALCVLCLLLLLAGCTKNVDAGTEASSAAVDDTVTRDDSKTEAQGENSFASVSSSIPQQTVVSNAEDSGIDIGDVFSSAAVASSVESQESSVSQGITSSQAPSLNDKEAWNSAGSTTLIPY